MVTITKYLNYTIGVPERFVDIVNKELKDLSINPKSINSMITHIGATARVHPITKETKQ